MFVSSLLVNAQEIDDMYFTSTDREIKKKLSKKVSPAEVILSKYRKGNTKINSTDVIDKSILEKYKSSNVDDISLFNIIEYLLMYYPICTDIMTLLICMIQYQVCIMV